MNPLRLPRVWALLLVTTLTMAMACAEGPTDDTKPHRACRTEDNKGSGLGDNGWLRIYTEDPNLTLEVPKGWLFLRHDDLNGGEDEDDYTEITWDARATEPGRPIEHLSIPQFVEKFQKEDPRRVYEFTFLLEVTDGTLHRLLGVKTLGQQPEGFSCP